MNENWTGSDVLEWHLQPFSQRSMYIRFDTHADIRFDNIFRAVADVEPINSAQ